jgi:hypothetical protein
MEIAVANSCCAPFQKEDCRLTSTGPEARDRRNQFISIRVMVDRDLRH